MSRCTGTDCPGCAAARRHYREYGCLAPECVESPALPLHRTEAGYPNCSTCDGGGCYDCTDPA